MKESRSEKEKQHANKKKGSFPLYRLLLPALTAFLGLCAAVLLTYAQEPGTGRPAEEQEPAEESAQKPGTGRQAEEPEAAVESAQEEAAVQSTEPTAVQDPVAEVGQVLIVYETPEEAEFLEELVRSLGRQPVTVSRENYREGLLQGADCLITTSQVCEEAVESGFPSLCLGDACLASPGLTLERAGGTAVSVELGERSEGAFLEQQVCYISGHRGREFGKLLLDGVQAPFAVKTDNRIDVPFYRTDGLCAVMVGEAMAQLFGKEGLGKMYLVLDEVYPFSDLGKLCEMADLLADSGIPFLVRVMPVYDNLDYPAFQNYLQVLRYLQAKNATVVLHQPVEGQGAGEPELLAGRLEEFRSALLENGVYERDFTYPPYTFSWQELSRITVTAKNFGTFSTDTMFTVPAEMPLEEFQELLGQINARWLSLSDYKKNFTDETYRYHEEPIREMFTYREETQADMKEFFSRADSILMLVVGAGLLVFGILLAIGSRWYHRKFY